MDRAQAEIMIRRAGHYSEDGPGAEFLPSYEELTEAAEAMLSVRLGENDPPPGRHTDNGWEMTREEHDQLLAGVEKAMGGSCPYHCTGEVELWKIAALFGYIDRLEKEQRLELLQGLVRRIESVQRPPVPSLYVLRPVERVEPDDWADMRSTWDYNWIRCGIIPSPLLLLQPGEELDLVAQDKLCDDCTEAVKAVKGWTKEPDGSWKRKKEEDQQ